MLENLLKLIFCHFVGDYVLQSQYLAEGKAKNWYLLLAHCTLYTLPYYIAFGARWQMFVIWAVHIAVDKAKVLIGKMIPKGDEVKQHRLYMIDQMMHGLTALIYLIG